MKTTHHPLRTLLASMAISLAALPAAYAVNIKLGIVGGSSLGWDVDD